MPDLRRSPRAALRVRLLRAVAYWSAGILTYNLLGGQGTEPSVFLSFGLTAWGAWQSRTVEGRGWSVANGMLLGLMVYYIDIAMQWVNALRPGVVPPYHQSAWLTGALAILLFGTALASTLSRERQMAKDAVARRA